MPTDKPRITITLNPHVYATLKRMSELGGQPMSTIISELLDSVHDPFMRTVALLDAAAQAPKQIKDGLRQSFEAVERELYGAVGYTSAQMDWLIEQLGKPSGGDAETGTRSGALPGSASGTAGAGVSRKANPHIVIRGSGSPVDNSERPPKKPGRP